jgi:DNA processing protein
MMTTTSTITSQNRKELMDIIALRCDFSYFKISGMLLNMELKAL